MFSGSIDAKERIRQSIDIVDLVGQYLELRRQGRNYVGLCPWHQDARPSLQVNPERQSWKCWVCDLGGDIFSFVMRREGLEFREALEMLAERADVDLGRRGPKPVPGSTNDKNTLYKAMAWATAQFHDCLVKGRQAELGRRYLAERHVEQGSIERFTLGFVPNEWQWLVNRAEQRFSPDVLQAVGLVSKSERTGRWFDRFRGRVIFPIRDLQGRPIAVGGRILPEFADDHPAKYINSPETRLFSKSEQLYGLDLARDHVAQHREVVIMEGYTDVVMARQSGIDHAVAVLGTALGQRHIHVLRRFADRITLLLDGDTAGQRRANEILDLFIANQIDLRIVTLPDNMDPCDFLLEHGREVMLSMVAEAPDAWEHRIQSETADIDPLRDTHLANRALENLLGTLAKAPSVDKTGSSAQRLREQQILNRLARQFLLDEQQLRQRLSDRRSQDSLQRIPSSPITESTTRPTPLPSIERDLLELLLQAPEVVPSVLEEVRELQLDTSLTKQLFQLFRDLVAAGREPSYENLMLLVDDPTLKNQIVSLDESAREKNPVDIELTLRELLHGFTRRIAEQQIKTQHATLQGDQLDDQQQLDALMKILEQKKQLMIEE